VPISVAPKARRATDRILLADDRGRKGEGGFYPFKAKGKVYIVLQGGVAFLKRG